MILSDGVGHATGGNYPLLSPAAIHSEDAALGAAWRRAEAALPEGWHLELYGSTANTYMAWAVVDGRESNWISDPGGSGSTPADALTALVALLEEREQAVSGGGQDYQPEADE